MDVLAILKMARLGKAGQKGIEGNKVNLVGLAFQMDCKQCQILYVHEESYHR